MSFLYSGLWSTTMNIKTFFFITMLMRNIKGCLTIDNTFTRSDAYLAFVNVQARNIWVLLFLQIFEVTFIIRQDYSNHPVCVCA